MAKTDLHNGPILHEILFSDVNIRRDQAGRIVLDECASDSAHLKSPEFEKADGRQRCRQLLEESFAKYVGKKGHLRIEIYFAEDK